MNDELDKFFVEIEANYEGDEYDPPSYKEPGEILFRIHGLVDDWRGNPEYDIEVFMFTGSAFWMAEGCGIDYWLNTYLLCEDLQPGWYVMEGVIGHYYRGDGWTTDDDEEFEFATLRYATQEEIDGECLYEKEE
jgi:hypothetical protein